MKSKVYIETSVVSYYTARLSRDLVTAARQQITQEFWTRIGSDFDPIVSALTLKEAGGGDPEQAGERLRALESIPVIQTTPDVDSLARSIVEGGGIPPEYPEDALHIALATMSSVDFLVTWNFAHINNAFTRMMIRQVVVNSGYRCPEIVSPEEFLGEEL